MTTAPAPADPGGSAPEADAPAPPVGPRSTRTPALVVLGLAVAIAVVGVIGSIVASGSAPTYPSRTVVLPDGSRVTMEAAAPLLTGLISDGQPPADVLGNLGLPRGSQVRGTISGDQGAAQFDRTARLTVPLAADQVIAAFRAALPRTGWQVIYTGGAPQGGPGATELLAKHGSSDGFYWEAGVVADPTAADGTTAYTVEILQLPDGG